VGGEREGGGQATQSRGSLPLSPSLDEETRTGGRLSPSCSPHRVLLFPRPSWISSSPSPTRQPSHSRSTNSSNSLHSLLTSRSQTPPTSTAAHPLRSPKRARPSRAPWTSFLRRRRLCIAHQRQYRSSTSQWTSSRRGFYFRRCRRRGAAHWSSFGAGEKR
jgi:hypothetical protein